MEQRLFLRGIACLVCFAGGFSYTLQAQEIPEELLEDDHFREEFGVNQLTTPSIRKIFQQIEDLGELSYEDFKRELPSKTSSERPLLAMSLGGLIADGFFIVYTEQIEELEGVGRSLLKHAQSLSVGDQIASHVKPLLEHSGEGQWTELREELAATQQDVEIEMIHLRDVHIVHLIGFGGWLRAFDVACSACLKDFSPEKAEILRRVDIVDYYVFEFEYFAPPMQKMEEIIGLRARLAELEALLNGSEGAPMTEDTVRALKAKVDEMTPLAFGS